jgi:hypothetical protein
MSLDCDIYRCVELGHQFLAIWGFFVFLPVMSLDCDIYRCVELGHQFLPISYLNEYSLVYIK